MLRVIEITSDEEENINAETVDSMGNLCIRALAARVFFLTNASFCRRTSNQSWKRVVCSYQAPTHILLCCLLLLSHAWPSRALEISGYPCLRLMRRGWLDSRPWVEEDELSLTRKFEILGKSRHHTSNLEIQTGIAMYRTWLSRPQLHTQHQLSLDSV